MKRLSLLGVILASTVVLSIVLAGCNAASTVPLAAEVIVNKAIASVSAPSVKTYSMDISVDGTVSLAMTTAGQLQNIAISTKGTGKGSFDVANKASKFTMETKTNAPAPLNQTSSMQVDSYLLDGVVYAGITDGTGKTTWTKMKAPQTGSSLPDATTLNDIIDLVRDAPVEKLGEEQVNGQTAYVIKVSPDMQKLIQLMLKGADLPTEGVDVAGAIGNSVKSFSVKLWVSKDSSYLLQEEGQIEMVLDSVALGVPSTSGTFTMTMNMKSQSSFTYNTKVSVTVPPEALAAPEKASP